MSLLKLVLPNEVLMSLATKRLLRQTLLQQIARGDLIPGASLPSERCLARQYQLSRNAVREVMQSLQQDGWVQTHQGSPTRCINRLQNHLEKYSPGELSLVHQLDVLEARAFLEGETAYYCALRASDQELQSLAQEYNAMQARRKGQSTLLKAKADLTFHMMIAEASHHLLLISYSQLFYERYFNAIHEVLSTTLKRYGRYPDGISLQHEKIHLAIQSRQPEQARLEATEHILYTRRLLEAS